MYKAFIKELLGQGKIEETLNLMKGLSSTQSNDYFNTPVQLLSGQFYGNQRDFEKGLDSQEDNKRYRTRMMNSLTNLLDSDDFCENRIYEALWISLTSNFLQKEVKKEIKVLKTNHNFFGLNMKNPNNLRTWMNLSYEPNTQAEFDELEQFTKFVLSYLKEQIEDKFEYEHLTFRVRVAEENFMKRKYPYSAMELKKQLATVEEVVIQLLELEVQELPIETQINNLSECGIDTFDNEFLTTINSIFQFRTSESKLDFLNFYQEEKLKFETLSENKVSIVKNKLFRDFKNTIISKLKTIF